MAFQKKTFVWHIGWYSKNLIAYYTLEQNLIYYFFSDYNSFAEILLSFRCEFEGCIFFVNTRHRIYHCSRTPQIRGVLLFCRNLRHFFTNFMCCFRHFDGVQVVNSTHTSNSKQDCSFKLHKYEIFARFRFSTSLKSFIIEFI